MRAIAFLAVALCGSTQGAEWTVPVGGNAFRTAPDPRGGGLQRDGTLRWQDAEGCFSIFFRADRPAVLDLSLEATGGEASAQVTATVRDKNVSLDLARGEFKRLSLGRIEVARAGYVEVVLRGNRRDGPDFGMIRALVVASDTPGVRVDFVKTPEGNMFYWGRRGPSVHLRYPLPAGKKIEYAYSEVTVPEGHDPIGSYFMANGFSGGYFGIQVKSESERWVLFSVWSPFRTDSPREIPEDQRVATLARGEGVTVRDFGNEGSGAQSFLSYPWKAGVTYRFLTRVRPDGEGSTVYTAWFGEKDGDWRLLASFRRPKTDAWLGGFHSFLENFSPAHGHLERKSLHGNQWVCDSRGQWHELTKATFTADATARGGHRLDYAGGVRDGRFFMHNCGFFAKPVKMGSAFERESVPASRPAIEFDQLPMK